MRSTMPAPRRPVPRNATLFMDLTLSGTADCFKAPASRHMRIAVRASGVNFADVLGRAGLQETAEDSGSTDESAGAGAKPVFRSGRSIVDMRISRKIDRTLPMNRSEGVMNRLSLAIGGLVLAGVAATVETGAQSPAPPTYSRDVAPILYRNCTACHRPGGIGPVSLLASKDVRPWAKSIAARVEAGTMPPWHADPSVGDFENDRRLSSADKDTIARWVAADAPEGDPGQLPPQPKYADGWMIGQPDAVLTMQ